MRFKAVGAGLVIDFIGSVCVGLVLGIVVSLAIGVRPDLQPEDYRRAASHAGVKAVGLAGTLFFTGLGSYVAARMSAPHEMANALAVGGLSLLLALGLVVAMPGVSPLWKIVAGVILTIPVALLGGFLAARKRRT